MGRIAPWPPIGNHAVIERKRPIDGSAMAVDGPQLSVGSGPTGWWRGCLGRQTRSLRSGQAPVCPYEDDGGPFAIVVVGNVPSMPLASPMMGRIRSMAAPLPMKPVVLRRLSRRLTTRTWHVMRDRPPERVPFKTTPLVLRRASYNGVLFRCAGGRTLRKPLHWTEPYEHILTAGYRQSHNM